MEDEVKRYERYRDTINRANRKYQDKFQQVKFYCEPDLYLEIKEYCEATGESVAAFLKRLARAEMESHPLPENSAK